jgi:predicted lactoylglutathione lyase
LSKSLSHFENHFKKIDLNYTIEKINKSITFYELFDMKINLNISDLDKEFIKTISSLIGCENTSNAIIEIAIKIIS